MEGGWINWGQPEVFLTGGESGGRFLYPVSLKNPQRNHKSMWSEGQSIQDKSYLSPRRPSDPSTKRGTIGRRSRVYTSQYTKKSPHWSCTLLIVLDLLDLERGAHLEPQSLGGISFLARGQAPSLVSTGVLLRVALPPDFSGWC